VYHTQGFQSYLITYTQGVGRAILNRQRFHSFDLFNDKSEDNARHEPVALPIQPPCSDLRGLIVTALRKTLTSVERWDFFHRTVYGGERLRGYALRTGCGRSKLSRTVAQPILLALREQLKEEGLNHGATEFDQFAAIVPEVLSEAEFTREIDHPLVKKENVIFFKDTACSAVMEGRYANHSF
jgi:hypothetical protein